jgi:undecaprenyl-diphosphatase
MRRRDQGNRLSPAAPDSKRLSNRLAKLAGPALLFWLPALAFFKIADEVREKEEVRVDSAFLQWLHSGATPTLDRIAIALTSMGSAPAITIAAVLISATLFRARHRRAAAFVVASVGGAAIADTLLKLWFQRVRPSLWSPVITELDYSFPSGHSMLSMVLALVIVSLLWQTRWRALSIALAVVYVFVIGLTRLYLGVHFPTDVVAGWCAGSIWVVITAKAIRSPLGSHRPAPPTPIQE